MPDSDLGIAELTALMEERGYVRIAASSEVTIFSELNPGDPDREPKAIIFDMTGERLTIDDVTTQISAAEQV